MVHFDSFFPSTKRGEIFFRRFFLLLLTLSAFSIGGNAQCLPAVAVPQTEGFNTSGTTVFPTCWTTTIVTASANSTAPAITFETSSTNPTASAPEGTRMIKFNSFSNKNGAIRLVALPVNTTSVTSVDVSFKWFNDNNSSYISYTGEGVQVQYSTDNVNWTDAGAFVSRPNAVSGWVDKTVTLPAGAAGQTTLYVGFKFVSMYGDHCYMDQVQIKASPSCLTPTALMANATSPATANISWTAPSAGTPIGYEYVVSPSNTTPSGSGVLVTTGTSASVGSLSPNTTYYLFVRTKCGSSSFSAWTNSVSFTTPCSPATLTQFEGFNASTNMAACWSTKVVNAGTGTAPDITVLASGSNPTSSPYEGANMIKFNSYSCDAGAQARLVSLPLNTTGVSSVDVEFYWLHDYNSNYITRDDNVQVQYSTDGINWTNAGLPVSRHDAVTAWKKKWVTLPAGAGNQPLVYVGFLFTSAYGDNCFMDAVKIKPSPTCYPPTNLAVSLTSGTSGTLTWGPPASGTVPSNYQYVVSATNTTPTGSGTTVTGTSAAIPLTASTTQYVFLRSFCGGTDFSEWEGPVIVTTPCASYSMPFTEPFSSTLPACWTSTYTGTSTVYWTTGTSDATYGVAGPKAGTHFAYLNVFNAKTANNPYLLTTPPIIVPYKTTLYYYYFFGSNGSSTPLTVDISSNLGNTWTTLYAHTTSNSTTSSTNSVNGWTPYSINLDAYAGQTVMLRFNATSNYGSGLCNMAIDEVELLPKAPTVTNSAQCGSGTPTCSVTSQTGVASPVFRWYTVATGGSPISGQSGTTLSAYSVSASTSFYVSEVIGSAESRRMEVQVTVNQIPTVTTSKTDVTCYNGSNGSATANVTGGTSPYSYSWNTTPAQTTAGISNLPGGSYTVTVKDSKNCTASATAVIADPGPATIPAIATQPINRTICSGTNTTFNASATGLNITYQWYVSTNGGASFTQVNNGGVYSGATSGTLTLTGAPVNMNNNKYYCIATGTCSPAATTNTVTLTVNETIPAVSISSSATTICAGSSVTFTATPTNGGATPAYQWTVNGFNVGTNSNTYTTTTLTNNAVVKVQLTSSANCPNPASITSTGINMTVNPLVTPSVSISSSQGTTVCAGTSVTFTATPVNGGSAPSYQWKKNGNNVGTNSAVYTTSAIANGDIISCIMTSNANCRTANTATSNSLAMNIGTLLTPAVSIVVTDDTICDGTSVTFTATPVNGGNNPVYAWKRNGITVTGTSGNTYSSSTLAHGDVITCVMTTSVSCFTSPTATSNSIDMYVHPILTPTLSIIASTDTVICSGTNVTFLALPVNGGANPVYQWRLNGQSMTGAKANIYSISVLNNGDVVTCDMASNVACPSVALVGSNALKFKVEPTAPPLVGIASDAGNVVKPGQTVTFSSTVLNTGLQPTYQWRKNGVDITGANGTKYVTNSLAANDQISLIVHSDMICAKPDSGISNTITMLINNSVANVHGHFTDVTLYPNPNKGQFIIEADMPAAASHKATYEILNNIGQVIGKGEMPVVNGKLKQDISLNEAASGTYFIRVTVGENSVVKRFNIQ